jgi:diguanylate cyclase (GGDEF)-like protein
VIDPGFCRRPIPARALAISAAALAVPVAGSLLMPDSAAEYELLLWLLALVPAFLLAYYRGWRGVAVALAGAMALLSLSQAYLAYTGRGAGEWKVLFPLLVVYLSVSLGIGWVSEALHRTREEAERLAFTDEVTGLPNRRFANLVLAREFEAARRGRRLSLVLFDLDGFKVYNDAHGHAAGDDALRAFARVLGGGTRRMNLSARFGGDEFLSVLSDADAAGALVFVARVRRALSAAAIPAPLTVSVGVAEWVDGMATPEDLLAAADRMLYQAKGEGRNRVCTSAPAVAEVPPALAS